MHQQPEMMKFRLWTVQNKQNLISQKVVCSIDQVILKSPFGNYLRDADGAVIADNTLI